MKRMIYALFLLCQLGTVNSHAQSWQWAKQMGGNIAGINTEDSRDEVLGLQVDKRGNSYVLFRTCTDLINPNKIQVDGTDINRKFGYRDFVLASLDCSGKLRWAKAFGGPSNVDNPYCLKIDTLGGIYISGYLSIGKDSASIDLDTLIKPVPVVPPLVPKPIYKSWVVIKYDSAGNYKWLRMPEPDTLAGSGRNSVSFSMDVSPNGKVSLLTALGTTGAFASGAYIVPASTALPALHTLQYDANGNFIKGFPMAITVTGTSPVTISYLRMAWDWKNDVYYIGAVKYIGEPALTFGSTAQTGSNLLAKFSGSGSLVWQKQSSATITPNIPLQPVWDESENITFALADAEGSTFIGHTIRDSFFSSGAAWALMRINGSGALIWGVNLSCKVPVAGGACASKNDKVAFYGGSIGGAKFGSYSMVGSGSSSGIVQLVLNANTGKLLSFDTVRGGNLCNLNAVCADAHGNFYSAYSYDVNFKMGSTTLGKYGGYTDVALVKWGEASCDPIPGTSIAEAANTITMKVYPNPAQDRIFVENAPSGTTLRLYNLLGAEVYSGVVGNTAIQSIPLNGLAPGMYLLQSRMATGEQYSVKVMKE